METSIALMLIGYIVLSTVLLLVVIVGNYNKSKLKTSFEDLKDKHEILDWDVFTIGNPLKFKYDDIVYSCELDKSDLQYNIEEFKVLDSWYASPPVQHRWCRVDIGGATAITNQNNLYNKDTLIERFKSGRMFKINVSDQIIDKDIINLKT